MATTLLTAENAALNMSTAVLATEHGVKFCLSQQVNLPMTAVMERAAAGKALRLKLPRILDFLCVYIQHQPRPHPSEATSFLVQYLNDE